MTPNDKISIETLLEYLVYDPTTGSLLWSKRTLSGTHSVGSPAGIRRTVIVGRASEPMPADISRN